MDFIYILSKKSTVYQLFHGFHKLNFDRDFFSGFMTVILIYRNE